MRSVLSIACLLGLTAPLACNPKSAATEVPASASQAVISMQGIDCESCGSKAIAKLEAAPGVYAARFDRVAAELTVDYDAAQTSPDALLAVVHTAGYEASLGAGQGAYLPEVAFDDLDVQHIAQGNDSVALRDHLAANKVTVFDFYAVWCKPCRAVDRHMKAVLTEQADVALRKLDVVDWDSTVATEHLAGVESLPFVVVYGPRGKKVAEISGLKLDELDAAIAKARSR